MIMRRKLNWFNYEEKTDPVYIKKIQSKNKEILVSVTFDEIKQDRDIAICI